MKKNRGKYREVTTIPPNAMTVSFYCLQEDADCSTTQGLYSKWQKRRESCNFEIVYYSGMNFVIPKKAKVA